MRRDERARELVRDGAQLVDVRSPSEFASGHVDGAVNLPLGDLLARLSEIDVAKPVVVYCRSGGRSAQAAAQLRERRFTVHDMGGIARWEGGVSWGRIGMALVLALGLGLAPFTPEPHLLGKLRWVAGGAVGMGGGDWFDLVLHGTPWLFLAWTLIAELWPGSKS